MQPETLPILPIDSGSLHHTLARLKPALQTADPALHSQVQAILQAVREKGDDALLDYTARFDRLTLPDAGALRIPPQMIAEPRHRARQNKRDGMLRDTLDQRVRVSPCGGCWLTICF